MYGVDSKPGAADGTFIIAVRALKKVTIAVSVADGGVLSATATVGGVEGCELLRIWVETRPNMIGFPTVVHVDVFARTPEGEVVTERHLP